MSYFSQIGALTVEQFAEPGHRHRRGHRHGPGLLPAQLADHRELLGRHDPRPALHRVPHRLRRRDHLRRPGGGADPGRTGQHPRRPERGHPDHRPGPDRLHGGDQAARQQRRRVPQRQLGDDLREPDRPDQLAVDLPAAGHPLLPHLHLRQDGGQHPPRRRPAGGHGASSSACWVGFTSYAEHQHNPAVAAAGVHSTVGNTEGKEVRFGDTTTALFGVASTNTSTGSADASYDSFTPMGGFGLLTGMMLGEVTPGGTGSGLYTILIYAIIAVFIGGLMIGRTPEYLGKKIQAKEVKLAGLGALVMPIIVLVFTGHRRLDPRRAGRPAQRRPARVHRDPLRPHLAGQQQRLGLRRPDRQHRLLQHHRWRSTCCIGRFGIMIPALALGGVAGRQERGPRRRSAPSAPTTPCSSA